MSTRVSAIPPAASPDAAVHFESLLRFETDCWDVHDSLARGVEDFVLVDVRSPTLFGRGHVRGAINIPHSEIDEARLRTFPASTLFVVYCAGPHCNGANRAALHLARLERPVKMMIGGVTGWLDEGFELERSV